MAAAAALAACGLAPTGPMPEPAAELGVIIQNRTQGEVRYAFEAQAESVASSGEGVIGACQASMFSLPLGGTWHVTVGGERIADHDRLPQLRQVPGAPRDWTLTLRADPGGITIGGLEPGNRVGPVAGGEGPIAGCP